MIKINPDRVHKLVEATKILAEMPFSVSVNTISGPRILLFDDVDFDNTFPDYKILNLGNLTYHTAKRDGIIFEHIVRMEDDDD